MRKLKKVLPALALLFGITVYTVQAAIAKWNTSTDVEWRLTGTQPANPDSYTQAPPGTQEDCEGNLDVCIVIAPADSEGKPDFDSVPNLEQALENNEDHDNIIRGPYSPPQ